MYTSDRFKMINDYTFEYELPQGRAARILQLTDSHLGFGLLSRKKDTMALAAMKELIERTQPDLIVFTGDQIFPYLPKAGTMDNRRQSRRFLDFMDSFEIPYTLIMGNHDTELGSRLNRKELGQFWTTGRYSIFAEGPEDIFGIGNYMLRLTRNGRLSYIFAMLDSNMYRDGWFYSGFDCVHADQSHWCMQEIIKAAAEGAKAAEEGAKAAEEDADGASDLQAFIFLHMPPKEFREAYEKMKLGDESVRYHFGSIGERDEYFGISRYEGDLFERALECRYVKGLFCGHDHLNTISLTYKGIRMTYGMSIDCLGYKGITESFIQRGATLIELPENGGFTVRPVPLTTVVSHHIRGIKD